MNKIQLNLIYFRFDNHGNLNDLQVTKLIKLLPTYFRSCKFLSNTEKNEILSKEHHEFKKIITSSTISGEKIP